MPASEIPEQFLVAFSFAGEQRELVESIATAVEERLGKETVFFDKWYEHYIAGDGADLKLQKIYHEHAVLVVLCVSSQYGSKPWTLAEHEAIRALKMQLSSGSETDRLRILPLRVGDGDVPGIFMNAICPDIRKKPPSETAQLIVNRLRLLRPQRVQKNVQRVYLAECTPDLDDATKPVNRSRLQAFLEDLGWTVLSPSQYPTGEYASLLERDLKECLAFIQLLGPYPWRRGDFDRLQNKAAEDLGVTRFRYRSSEIDLMNVDETHKKFITEPDVICGGFEDFKAHLKQKLSSLAQRHERDAYEGADNQPLVRVVVRSTNPDALWEKAFQWIYEAEKILSDQLGPGESFEAKHRVDPCHGFMIICDAAALEDGPLSPREYLQQCRLIQISEKNAARRPPVAVVYWPPPPPSWAKLVRCTPQRLHQVEGDAPDKLAEFFAQVRQVAQ